MKTLITLTLLLTFFGACKSSKQNQESKAIPYQPLPGDKITNRMGDTIATVVLSEAQWKEKLTPEEFRILRQKGTEAAFTGDLWDNKKDGLYTCAGCDQVIFSSNAKYESGTGWPSFFRPDDENMIKRDTDYHIGYPRTEVMCARCGGHLGHVFEDGPPPTGLRYCLNSAALNFIESKQVNNSK
ncbi:MAG TPA: peptide-methionine (R)-S-oxide reductase MsrB [Saprospiraceae bacterium]|nr:peptide-methionine (R)-S-oxide reductase MsrB [Saprospiraceae bacterium]HRG19474.1 peptide-methionine (R)-S-oxide reductase MsrB [Saprospiraceae bacterium]